MTGGATLRDKIAALDLAPDERKRITDFMDEQDRVATESAAKRDQYHRVRHIFGTDAADIALTMIAVRKVDKTSPEAWDAAAKHAHAYLVATSG